MTYSADNSSLLESISNDIANNGYSICPDALPKELTCLLLQHTNELPEKSFKRAGIGRTTDHAINDFIRTDEISWIESNSEASCSWIKWTTSLQDFLNRRLFLGLFSFESHFSHYAKGDFYKNHKDPFKGEENRVLSVVVYLNPNWSAVDGVELVIYKNQLSSSCSCLSEITVTTNFGTIVVFLSKEFPHGVLPVMRDRYSIAGWFRVNNACLKSLILQVNVEVSKTEI